MRACNTHFPDYCTEKIRFILVKQDIGKKPFLTLHNKCTSVWLIPFFSGRCHTLLPASPLPLAYSGCVTLGVCGTVEGGAVRSITVPLTGCRARLTVPLTEAAPASDEISQRDKKSWAERALLLWSRLRAGAGKTWFSSILLVCIPILCKCRSRDVSLLLFSPLMVVSLT